MQRYIAVVPIYGTTLNKLKIDKRDLDWAVERIKKYYKNIDVASIAKLIKQGQQNETPSTDSGDEILRSRVLYLLGLINGEE